MVIINIDLDIFIFGSTQWVDIFLPVNSILGEEGRMKKEKKQELIPLFLNLTSDCKANDASQKGTEQAPSDEP